MLGYDLYGSALADILTEPSLSMPITVGLYAKWGSGKSFLLNKLRDEMESFARDWIDPTFQFSPLLLVLVFHLSTALGMIIWIATFYAGKDKFIALCGIPVVFVSTYCLLFAVRHSTFITDITVFYNINVFLARKFNELKLLVNVVFCHPSGSGYISRQVKAQPLKLFFTDQSKVSTSAGAENSVIQIIGSLYDSLENTYGTFSTRLYRAFRPTPAKSTSPQRLRKLCCVPYAALYIFSYTILVIEIFVVIVKIEIHYGGMELEKITKDHINELLLILAIILGIILGLLIVSNMYTIGRVLNALIFSQRTHLQRAVAKHDLIQSEGYLQAVKREVNLLQHMVKALDSFSGNQSRLIVIVDGLDSVEQRKILTVLDTVHSLFSNPGLPFIIVLAIDPHVIIKAIELNLNQVFSDTSIGGHAYLRNMVHLPFFLQNAGLRKVKIAQQLASKQKMSHSWHEVEDPALFRRTSIESDDIPLSRSISKLKRRKRMNSESVENSIASNLHKISSGQSPLELNKMFLTDDYFSDVNPRSMRRLMNVIYVMGRLLKAFSIDFSWHHLSSWANITEQWPYRTSWITLYVETCEDNLDDNFSLKQVYDKVKPMIPTQKEMEPMLEMDRDEKKLDVFLAFHKKTLTVANLKIFLPFTINLDPFIKKVIKEEVQNLEELGINILTSPSTVQPTQMSAKAPLTRRQAVGLSKKMNTPQENVQFPVVPGLLPNIMGLQQWLGQQQFNQLQPFSQAPEKPSPPRVKPVLPNELKGLVLSELNVEQICTLLKSIDQLNPSMLETYCATITSNNVTGRVLTHCQLDELRNVLNMNFGDWELFKLLLVALREEELAGGPSPTHPEHLLPQEKLGDKLSRMDSGYSHRRKLSVMERQVALEQATVSGLLSTLNEDAHEDILIEEINNAREEAGRAFSDRTSDLDEEADVLYYTNPHSVFPSNQNIDVLSETGHDLEKAGSKKVRRDQEIVWSALSSRQGSISADLDTTGTTSPHLTHSSLGGAGPHISSIMVNEKEKDSKQKKRMDFVDRAKTALTLRPVSIEEDNPYAWLSKTAPPSPGSIRRTKKRQDSESDNKKKKDSESENKKRKDSETETKKRKDSETEIKKKRQMSESENKKKKETKEVEMDLLKVEDLRLDIKERDSSRDRLSRVSSRDRINKVKRRIQSALNSHEPGTLPAVQRAKPNQEDYDDLCSEASRSPSPARRGASTRQNSRNASTRPNSTRPGSTRPGSDWSDGSEESLSSPEQRTVFKRPNEPAETRPNVQKFFSEDNPEDPSSKC